MISLDRFIRAILEYCTNRNLNSTNPKMWRSITDWNQTQGYHRHRITRYISDYSNLLSDLRDSIHDWDTIPHTTGETRFNANKTIADNSNTKLAIKTINSPLRFSYSFQSNIPSIDLINLVYFV